MSSSSMGARLQDSIKANYGSVRSSQIIETSRNVFMISIHPQSKTISQNGVKAVLLERNLVEAEAHTSESKRSPNSKGHDCMQTERPNNPEVSNTKYAPPYRNHHGSHESSDPLHFTNPFPFRAWQARFLGSPLHSATQLVAQTLPGLICDVAPNPDELLAKACSGASAALFEDVKHAHEDFSTPPHTVTFAADGVHLSYAMRDKKTDRKRARERERERLSEGKVSVVVSEGQGEGEEEIEKDESCTCVVHKARHAPERPSTKTSHTATSFLTACTHLPS